MKSLSLLVRLLAYGFIGLSFGIPLAGMAQECDCTQIIGTCNARIQTTPTGTKKGQYGADLDLFANAPACAKIEYYVDNTPAFTILNNGHQGSDRILGTSEKPFTKQRVTLDACRVCKTAEQAAADRTKEEKKKAEDEARAQQAEVERLVAEGMNSGKLNPKSSTSGESFMDSAMKLQQQLQTQQPQQTRPKNTCPAGYGMSWDGRCYDCRNLSSALVCPR